MTSIWVIVPAFNEAENLDHLLPRIFAETTQLGSQVQVLVVDDGSTDSTSEVLGNLCVSYPRLQYQRVPRNRGKAAALRLGFQYALNAGASVVVMMDADGQDDPAEVPRLVREIDSGFDLVTGARVTRRDRFIKRTTSRWFNRVTGAISGAPGNDFNSGFKVMTAATAADVTPMLYGELHRYITVIAHWLGYRTTEVPVDHHERMHGTTKYGVNRFWRGLMDLITVKFLMSYENRPSHLFGGLGIVAFLIGGVMLTWLFIERLMGQTVGDRPMLIAGVLLVVVGLQLVLFGLLAELVVYSRQQARNSARQLPEEGEPVT